MRASVSTVICFLLLAGSAGPADQGLLRSGPMVGWVDLRQAVVWAQTTRPAEVKLRFFPEGRRAQARDSAPVRTSVEGDLIALLDLWDLAPGTRYEYELLLDGKPQPRPYPASFATQPLWRFRAEPPDFSAMVGSCVYVNDAGYDRPGRGFGSDYEIFTTMAARKPDLMIWLGDNTYLREGDYTSPFGIRYRHAHTRALPEMQPLLAIAANYATWDDHDFGPNDGDGTYALKDFALDTFARYFPALTRGLRDVAGVFTRFSWADVEFFLLDDRYHRTPNRWPAGAEKQMFGPDQMRWLKEGLAASRASFKVVVNGNQVLNPLAQNEGMVHYPAERQELLDWIRARRVEGVVFVSGDRHWAELTRLELEGLYPLYEFTSSSLTAGSFRPQSTTPEFASPHRVQGTLFDEHNFGVMRFEGPLSERRVRLTLHDKTGAARWEHVLSRRDLALPN